MENEQLKSENRIIIQKMTTLQQICDEVVEAKNNQEKYTNEAINIR